MQAALDRVTERGLPGVRLLQAAYHGRSLALYTTLGFQPREAIACMQGRPIGASLASYRVRRARGKNGGAFQPVLTLVPGPHPGRESADSIQQGTASVP